MFVFLQMLQNRSFLSISDLRRKQAFIFFKNYDTSSHSAKVASILHAAVPFSNISA